MMMSLFDQDEVTKISLAAQRREGRQEGLQEGIQKGHHEGLQEGLQVGRQEGHQEGHQEGRQEGIEGAITIMRDMGLPDREIAEKIRDQYGLTEDEADKLLAVKA
ncbi:MAG: hypothetical protein VZQ80_08565 [Lachnospiraceae bacterium]|nr:hypothetical protein [Lachnospiraceae bacterium]